jgi:AsnC-type helix-turn-helix domain
MVGPPAVDGTDHEIIELLQVFAGRTLGTNASRVGLSTPAVKRRIARVERIGVVMGRTGSPPCFTGARGHVLHVATDLPQPQRLVEGVRGLWMAWCAA